MKKDRFYVNRKFNIHEMRIKFVTNEFNSIYLCLDDGQHKKDRNLLKCNMVD